MDWTARELEYATIPTEKLVTAHDTKGLMPFDCGAAIFDFDGTIAQSLDAWRHVDDLFFERRNIVYDPGYAEQLSILGFEEGALYTIEAYGLSETPQEICNEWNELAKDLYRTEVGLYPGVQEYLRNLQRQGTPIGLATTNQPEILEAMAPRIDIDTLLPIRTYGKDVANPTKRDPDIYLECARRLNVDPTECVVFEDMPVAITTARKVGMKTVAILTDASKKNVTKLIEEADFILTDWRILA